MLVEDELDEVKQDLSEAREMVKDLEKKLLETETREMGKDALYLDLVQETNELRSQVSPRSTPADADAPSSDTSWNTTGAHRSACPNALRWPDGCALPVSLVTPPGAGAEPRRLDRARHT